MIVIANKRSKADKLLQKFPGAIIADVTSNSVYESLQKLSPFYPHGDIPVPFSSPLTASCVEAIWQGLKVFQNADIDTSLFHNSSMKGLKRTVRRFGPPLGHRKGVAGRDDELLSYLDARRLIYLPSYKWMLENHCLHIIERLRKANADGKTIILLDYNTNENVDDPSKPLSHAALVKAYALGLYPFAGPDLLDSPPTSSSTH